MPERAFISIGSNIEPEKYLPLAVARLGELGTVVALSQVYQGPALADTPQADYLNAAAVVATQLEPLAIRARLREIEAGLGRVRSADKCAPRTIDLDLCLYGDVVLNTEELTLPDPDIPVRAHLAIPFAEIARGFPYPGTGEPLGVLAERLRPSARLAVRPDIVLSVEPRR